MSTQSNYLYHGPQGGVTLACGEEIILRSNRQVSLPQDHPYVMSLIAQGHLEPIDSKAVSKTKRKGS